MSHRKRPPPESDVVTTFRLNNGLCHMCGTRIYEIVDHHSRRRRLAPVTIPGVVLQGRCLFCYPDPNRNEAVDGFGSVDRQSHNEPLPMEATSRGAVAEMEANSHGAVAEDSEKKASIEATSNGAVAEMEATSNGAVAEDSEKIASSEKQSKPAPRPAVVARGRVSAAAAKNKPRAPPPVAAVAKPKPAVVIPLPSFRQLPQTKEGMDDLSADEGRKSPANKRAAASRKTSGQAAEPAATDQHPKITLRDADGEVFSGVVTAGTLTKGRATVTHFFEAGEYAGRTSYYEGEFLNGMFHGQGYQRDATGCVYEGSFKHGASSGHGTCRWPSGWVYTGEWVDDLRSGMGTCRQETDEGQVYKGEWKNDCWHGKGELSFAGGDVYTGDFREDKMCGHGRYVFSDGSQYDGAFKNDVRCGHGRMQYADGQRYEGSWRNNWREGEGKLYYNNGSVYEGTFHADERRDGFLRMPDGISRPVRNGEVQH